MAEPTELVSKNFPVSTTIKRIFIAPVPEVKPSLPAAPENYGAELFSVSLTVPEHVSRVTIYPSRDENMSYGQLISTTNPGDIIQYQMVDKDGNKMMKDAGVDVNPNEQVVFRAINNRVDARPVSPGTYNDQLMVGYYVN
ncbi:CS6 fimbrial subunit A (CS6 pilin) [Escherichia coli TA054]|nr:CS6 fimbrial subunit A (CS6 pilin) [Escherichia coli TA054]